MVSFLVLSMVRSSHLILPDIEHGQMKPSKFRHFFSDEREVRAVVWSLVPEHIRQQHIEPFLTADRRGFCAPIEPNALIHNVVLHPKATTEVAAKVSELCKIAGLIEPNRSRIAALPQF
jgi:hypothetical protein